MTDPRAAPIYLDNNSTTAPAPEVVEAMLPFYTEHFANPSSPHPGGERAADAVRAARGHVAQLLGGSPRDVVFTSGGSESINAAFGAARLAHPERPRYIVSAVEHSATKASAKRAGTCVEIAVDANGLLDREALFAAIDSGVALVSLLFAGNETGVLNDLAGIGDACRAAGTLFHVDAVQAPGKMPIDAPAIGCDLLTIAAHKFHGPKGVGASWVRPGVALDPLVVGGPQESERRAGTENVPGIVGMGRAAELAQAFAEDERGLARIRALRDRLERRLVEAIPGARVHGAGAKRVANTTNVLFPGLEASLLLALLGEFGVYASAGSACNAQRSSPSPVLIAMGISPEEAASSLRFSLSRYSTEDEIEAATGRIIEAVGTLHALND
ncbi:MAG: cysteine desulfurase [bacterium]|nr:cysteine desulfurase [bacterium]